MSKLTTFCAMCKTHDGMSIALITGPFNYTDIHDLRDVEQLNTSIARDCEAKTGDKCLQVITIFKE